MNTGARSERKTGLFRRPSWSPYVVGTLIGALETLAMLTAKRPLGVTTAFETTAALAAKSLAPKIMETERYERERGETPKIDWQWALVAGIVLGSSVSARISREKLQAVDTGPADRNSALPVRYGKAAVGGALMMFGARMAKGCTSGHGISGTMQFAASSWLFTPIIFGVGALVVRMLQGRIR